MPVRAIYANLVHRNRFDFEPIVDLLNAVYYINKVNMGHCSLARLTIGERHV